VYFATYLDGRIHRLDRQTGDVEEVADYDGDSIYTWGLDVAPDGLLYASTSNNSRIYEIDPTTKSTTAIGPIAETEKYAYDVAVTESDVYVGVGNTENGGLYRVERSSHDISAVRPSVIENMVTKIAVSDEYIVGNSLYNDVVIVDREDPSNTRIERPINSTWAFDTDRAVVYYPVFPADFDEEQWPNDDQFHARNEAALYSYDPETTKREKQFSIPDFEAPGTVGLQWRSTHISDETYVAVQNKGGTGLFVADVQSGEHSLYDLPSRGMKQTAVTTQTVSSFDGKPVTAKSGGFFIHDVEAGTTTELTVPDEPTGAPKRFVEVDGTLYMGIYTGAIFVEFDGENLTKLGAANGQVRPYDLIYSSAANAVVMGTQPNYSVKSGGAIATLDLGSQDVTTHKNAIPDQSVRSLAAADEAIYAGGDVNRGLGTGPVTDEAKLARFDLESMERTWDLVPVPGEERIYEVFLTDDTIVGIAGRTLFAVDPANQSVIDTIDVGSAVQQFNRGQDGHFYAAAGPGKSGILRVNGKSLTIDRIQGGTIQADAGESTLIDGTLYYPDKDTWELNSVEAVGQMFSRGRG
jgi:hypothetical protein